MLERLVIAVVLMGVGIAAYQLWKVWNLRQVSKNDVFAGFMPGKPAIVLFSADYCMPCRYQQQPAIQRVLKEFGADRLQFITIDVENTPDIAESWNILSLPTTFILDKKGTPRNVNPGVTLDSKLKQQLANII